MSMENTKISVDFQAMCQQLSDENKRLMVELSTAKSDVSFWKGKASHWENRYNELNDDINKGRPKKRTPEERAKLVQEKKNRMLRGKNALGRNLPHEAEPIDSYYDYVAIREALRTANKNTGDRDAMLWTIGIALGLRVSDIVTLQWGHLFNPDMTWREYIPAVEKKTSKLNNCAITEIIKETVTQYLQKHPMEIDLAGYVFTNTVGNKSNHVGDNQIFKSIQRAAENAQIPQHIGSHSMRKSFVKIVECCFNANLDEQNLVFIQQLLNHDNCRTTYKYMGLMKDECDKARRTVSDFLMGKIDNKQLERPQQVTNNDLADLLRKAMYESKAIDKQDEENK